MILIGPFHLRIFCMWGTRMNSFPLTGLSTGPSPTIPSQGWSWDMGQWVCLGWEPTARQGRAVVSWRPALLQGHRSRGWQCQDNDMGIWTVGRVEVKSEALQNKAPAGSSRTARPFTHLSNLKETPTLFYIQIYWASEDFSLQEKLLSSIFQTGYPNTDPALLQVEKVKDATFNP